jgi:hypothetical protein
MMSPLISQKRFYLRLLVSAACAAPLFAQSVPEVSRPAEIPLRRVALFSSGVGYFEHAGSVSGSAAITLPFGINAVNDALKSLTINDPGSSAPAVRYPSERTLDLALKSLRIDLSGNPGAAGILGGLRGAEVDLYTPSLISGRILGVEERPGYRAGGIPPEIPGSGETESWLSLYTPQGIRVIALKDIVSFVFKDRGINDDLNRALDLIMASRDSETRNLTVELPGGNPGGSRPVSISYVIPAPVWKASYRLDLGREAPLLQGWAIVDNDGDTDWTGVELSLVTGRPVSFIQNLYPPYHLPRPVLPLAIAGAAEARTYDSGRAGAGVSPAYKSLSAEQALAYEADESYAPRQNPVSGVIAGGVIEPPRGEAAGDQFEFTLKGPVTLARRQSAMLPLAEGTVGAKKTLVFSGARAAGGGTIHPAVGAELTNTMGIKLPAGPVTVYDGGTYAGDALIEFFPEQEKRIISYGEDLSVTGSVSLSNTTGVTSVTVSGGVMTVNRKRVHERVYAFKNASGETKALIVEHPVTGGAALAEPEAFSERTGSLYRFERTLPAGGELVLTVKEENPISDRITLSQLQLDSFVSYASSREIPARVRAAMEEAASLRRRADGAQEAQTDLETRRARLIAEQDRIRRNLEAAGNQTQQGQEYLKRLVAMDGEIDALTAQADAAAEAARDARKAYEAYLASMEL